MNSSGWRSVGRALAAALWFEVASTLGAPALDIRAAAREGHLVLLGGGPTPEAVFAQTLRLSGGRSAVVAVLPQTYPNDSIGDAAVELWKRAGAGEVFKVGLDDMRRAEAALARATLIWIPGGFQGLFMQRLAGTPIPDAIRKRYAEGATIGGASAGAAAMSATMLADEVTLDGQSAEWAQPPVRALVARPTWQAIATDPTSLREPTRKPNMAP